jgi:transcriptional regulator with GAF, ATPase, and Fis domain
MSDDSRNIVDSVRGGEVGRRVTRAALEPVLRPLAETALAVAEGRLARIWLIGPGDLCATCPMRPECANQTRCLHLVASAGLTARTDGQYRRWPLGAREVGRVPVSGNPYEANGGLETLGLADPQWLATHRIRSFTALPLLVGGRAIGVLAVFGGRDLDPDARAALAGLARLGATALASVRAYGELAAERNRVVAGAARGQKDAASAARLDAPDPRPESGALRPLADLERDAIARVLAHTGGRVSGPRGAANVLGLKPTTLFSRMKKLGVERKPRR